MSFTAIQGRANLLHKALRRLFGWLGTKASEKVTAKDLQDIAARAERL